MEYNRQWFHEMADDDGYDDAEDGDGGDEGDEDDDGGDEGDEDGVRVDGGDEGGYGEDSDEGDEGGDGDGLANNGQGVKTNSASEDLGNIHPPYGCIIASCIIDIFRTTSKDWQCF